MSVWTAERVLATVPDARSRVAAHTLTAPSRWVEAGRTERGDETVLWGRCQGSARTPYEVVAAVGDAVASTCSCPSRRSPCKHALGLLLRWTAGQLPTGELPPYAERRRTARSPGPAAPSPEEPARRADPAAAARRAAQRAERVDAGLAELGRWLRDQVRGGLAGFQRAGYPHVEAVAARMVDAQAPGVAGLLRGIPGELSGPDWPERALQQLAAVHLVVEAHRRLGVLPPDLATTVRSRVGYPVAKEEVLAGPGVADRWLAVGSVDVVEGRLPARRVWLYGTRTGRWALLLSFAPPGGALDDTVRAGQDLDAHLHFYPGSGQYRALVGAPADLTDVVGVAAPPAETLGVARDRFARLLAADPWAVRMPAVVAVAPVPPAAPGEPWRLRDAAGASRPVDLPADPWVLLAHSGGDPVSVAGEWSRQRFRPLSVLDHGDDRVEVGTDLLGRAA